MACNEAADDGMEDFIEIPKNPAFISRQAIVSNQLRNNKELTDFTILSEGQTFPCHSIILASSSDMFLGMFRTAMKESTKREVKLPTVSAEVVKVVLEYIYMGTVKVPSHLVLATIKAANYLDLPELKADCVKRAHHVLKPGNVISFHKLAHELNLEELKQRCSELLSKSLVDVAKGVEFKNLSRAELIIYLKDMLDSEADNDDKLEAALAWGAYDPGPRKKDIHDLMQYVVLSRCSIQCIEEAIENHSDLLDKRMYRMLAQSLATIAKQTTAKSRRGNEQMLVVIAGHVNKCWQVDASMAVTELCKGFQCTNWYSACEVPIGFVLTGGEGSVLCMMYVASTQSWIQLTSLRAERYGHSSIFLDGKIFVFAGFISKQKSKSVQSLRLAGGEWNAERGLPVAMIHPEVALANRFLFLLDTDTNMLLCLDDDAREWKEKARCPGESGHGPRMISVNKQLLVAGGTDRLCARYTPATDTWITCSPPSLQHLLGALVTHNDKIYLISGQVTDQVEEYDLASDSWSVCNWALPEKVMNPYAVRIDIS